MKLVVTVEISGGRATEFRVDRVSNPEPGAAEDVRECAALADVLSSRIRRFQARGRPDGTPPKKTEKNFRFPLYNGTKK